MKKTLIVLSITIFAQFTQADTYNFIPNLQVNIVNSQATNHTNNSTSRSYTLYRDRRTYHLGDERIRGRKWVALHDQCYFIDFKGGSGNYILGIDMFGTESAALFINKNAIGYLPRQIAHRGHKRPNYWSGKEWIEVPNDMIRNGNNTLAICSSPVQNPEFRGDVDDFQIRDIELTVDR